MFALQAKFQGLPCSTHDTRTSAVECSWGALGVLLHGWGLRRPCRQKLGSLKGLTILSYIVMTTTVDLRSRKSVKQLAGRDMWRRSRSALQLIAT